jgi:hypothetical protein
MKFGKSLLLGELLKADDVEYSDVSDNRFWIVCPSCNEAIFKVVRNAEAEKPPLHYFSHYGASKAYVAECELRVGRITERDVAQLALESRDQELAFFIRGFHTLIHDKFQRSFPNTSKWNRTWFHLMKHSSVIASLRNHLYETVVLEKIKHASDDELFSAFDQAFSKLRQGEQNRLNTSLSMYTQKRIAVDLLKHLASPQGRPTFDTLFNHTFAWYEQRIRTTLEAHSALGGNPLLLNDEVLSFMEQLPITKPELARQMIVNLALKKLELTKHNEYDNCLLKWSSNLLSEMFIVLLRLPYLDALRRSITDRPTRKNQQ